MRRFLPIGIAVGAAGVAIGTFLFLRQDGPAGAPVPVGTAPVAAIDLTEAAPAPAPTGPVVAEIAGSAGRILPVAAPDARTLSADGEHRLVEFARRTGTDALLVWQGGRCNWSITGEGIRPFDRLEGRGLEAGLMALLVGRALQQGHVQSLEDRVVAWIGEWLDDPRGAITLRQLLQGTSGLDVPAAPPEPGGTLAWTLAAPLGAAPDTRFAPNAMELQVLGLVLARAARQPLPAFLGEAFWQPLGARPAEMRVDAADGTALLTCCVAATARDWLRLGLLLLDGGSVDGAPLVPTPWVDAIQRPTAWSRNDGLRVRLAWPFDPQGPVAARERFREPDTVFLAGTGGQRLYVSKAAELVVLRLGAPVDAWDEAELANLVARHIQVPEAPPRRPSGNLTGVELPPITTPPPIPKVEAVPLDAAPAAATSDPGPAETDAPTRVP